MEFSWQNVIAGNGVALSLGGMAIVFGGLILISVYIALLPTILNLLDKRKKSGGETEKPEFKYTRKREEEDPDKDIAAVIGIVLQMEQERLVQSGGQAITFGRDHFRKSQWSGGSRARELPERRINA